MTNKEMQDQIEESASILLKSAPEVLQAMAARANEAERSVAYFRKLKNKGRVEYEMRNFLLWLKKTIKEQEGLL